MFTVTESALDCLADALGKIEEPKPPDACFRVVPVDGGKLTLTVGTPDAKDTEYEREGVTVLVVSQEIRDRCEGRTLDSDDSGNLVLM